MSFTVLMDSYRFLTSEACLRMSDWPRCCVYSLAQGFCTCPHEGINWQDSSASQHLCMKFSPWCMISMYALLNQPSYVCTFSLLILVRYTHTSVLQRAQCARRSTFLILLHRSNFRAISPSIQGSIFRLIGFLKSRGFLMY